MRISLTLFLRMLLSGLLPALAGAGAVRAAESAPVTITLEPQLWIVNGDLVRQPSVPAA